MNPPKQSILDSSYNGVHDRSKPIPLLIRIGVIQRLDFFLILKIAIKS